MLFRSHLRQLKAIDPAFEVAVLRQSTSSTDLGELQPLIARVFLSEAQALDWRPDAVLVTNPSPLHIRTAMTFGGRGSHLFIEKPLSDNVQDLDALKKLVVDNGLIVQVGYVLRFMDPFLAIKAFLDSGRLGRVFSLRAAVGQDLRTWRVGKDYHQTVTALRGLGGGVVLELSHELDYALWFMGPVASVQALTGTVGNLGVEVEDLAEVQVKFTAGTVGNIHLDMLDAAQNRSCRIVGQNGTLVWSSEDGNKVKFFEALTSQWLPVWDGLLEADKMFRLQMEHFIECVKVRRVPQVTIDDGRRALELALAVKRSALERREVLL